MKVTQTHVDAVKKRIKSEAGFSVPGFVIWACAPAAEALASYMVSRKISSFSEFQSNSDHHAKLNYLQKEARQNIDALALARRTA